MPISHQDISASTDGSSETSRSSASGDRLGQTASGDRCESLDGKRNLREAWRAEIRSHLEVIEDILQKHLFASHSL